MNGLTRFPIRNFMYFLILHSTRNELWKILSQTQNIMSSRKDACLRSKPRRQTRLEPLLTVQHAMPLHHRPHSHPRYPRCGYLSAHTRDIEQSTRRSRFPSIRLGENFWKYLGDAVHLVANVVQRTC